MPILPAFIGGIATGVNANAAMEKQAALDLKTKTAVARATAGLTAAEENQIFKTGIKHHLYGQDLEDLPGADKFFTHSRHKDIKTGTDQNIQIMNDRVRILSTPIPGLRIDQGEFKDKDLNVLQYAKATGQSDKIENMMRPLVGNIKSYMNDITKTDNGSIFLDPPTAMPFTTNSDFIRQVYSNMWMKSPNYITKQALGLITAPDFANAKQNTDGKVEINVNAVDIGGMVSYHTEDKFAKMYRVDPMKLASQLSARFHEGRYTPEEFIVNEVLQGKSVFSPMDQSKMTELDKTMLPHQLKFEIQSDIAGVFMDSQKRNFLSTDVLSENKIMFLSDYFQKLTKEKGIDISALNIIDIIAGFYQKDGIVKGGQLLNKLGYQETLNIKDLFTDVATDISNLQKPNKRINAMLRIFQSLDDVDRVLPMGGLAGLVLTSRGILSTGAQVPEAKDQIGSFMEMHKSRKSIEIDLKDKFSFMKSRFIDDNMYDNYTEEITKDYNLMFKREKSLFEHIRTKYSGNEARFNEAIRNGTDETGANLLRNTAVATMRFHSYLLAFDLAAAIQGGGDSRTISDKDVGLMQQAIMWRFFTSNMDFRAVLGEVQQMLQTSLDNKTVLQKAGSGDVATLIGYKIYSDMRYRTPGGNTISQTITNLAYNLAGDGVVEGRKFEDSTGTFKNSTIYNYVAGADDTGGTATASDIEAFINDNFTRTAPLVDRNTFTQTGGEIKLFTKPNATAIGYKTFGAFARDIYENYKNDQGSVYLQPNATGNPYSKFGLSVPVYEGDPKYNKLFKSSFEELQDKGINITQALLGLERVTGDPDFVYKIAAGVLNENEARLYIEQRQRERQGQGV